MGIVFDWRRFASVSFKLSILVNRLLYLVRSTFFRHRKKGSFSPFICIASNIWQIPIYWSGKRTDLPVHRSLQIICSNGISLNLYLCCLRMERNVWARARDHWNVNVANLSTQKTVQECERIYKYIYGRNRCLASWVVRLYNACTCTMYVQR